MTNTLKLQTSMIALLLALSSAPQTAQAAEDNLPSSVLQQQAFERGMQLGFQQGKDHCTMQPAAQPRSANAPKYVIGNQFICEEIYQSGKKGQVVRTTLYSDGTSTRAVVAQGISMRGYNGFGFSESCEAKAEALNTGR